MALPPRVASTRAGKRAQGQGRLLVCAGRRKGRGWGVRTPSSLPAPALWAEPHRWGWAKGRALRRGPRRSSSFAAQPCARGLRGCPVPVWLGGRWARTQGLEQKRCLPRAPGTDRAGDAFPPTLQRQRLHKAAAPRERQGLWPWRPASQGSASLPSQRPAEREELQKAGTGAGGGAGWERSREHRGCTDKKHRMAGERSTVTSLFGQSTGLTAPQREDIRWPRGSQENTFPTLAVQQSQRCKVSTCQLFFPDSGQKTAPPGRRRGRALSCSSKRRFWFQMSPRRVFSWRF